MLTLYPEMTYRFTIRGPLSPTTGSPLGERQYFEMTAGTLVGERINLASAGKAGGANPLGEAVEDHFARNARIALPGGDWMWRSPDGFWRPDVRVQLITDDDAVVLLHYHGLVQQTEAFKRAASENRETGWTDQYMRMLMTFDAGAEKYAWLNQSLFIAEGRLLGASEPEYRIYRVGYRTNVLPPMRCDWRVRACAFSRAGPRRLRTSTRQMIVLPAVMTLPARGCPR